MASRSGLPLDRFTELAQLAYFQEERREAPRDLAKVARRLGVSLRTAGTLNKKLRGDFLAPESEVEPLRRLTARLLDGPVRRAELFDGLEAEDAIRLERTLDQLTEYGWIDDSNPLWVALATRHRNFVSDDLDRRVDGLNHQLDIVANSVQERFLYGNVDTAQARSWFFAARDEDIAPFIAQTVKQLRHGAIDLEEVALTDGRYRRFGVTVAITPVEETS